MRCLRTARYNNGCQSLCLVQEFESRESRGNEFGAEGISQIGLIAIDRNHQRSMVTACSFPARKSKK